jgi:hypothetical protein
MSDKQKQSSGAHSADGVKSNYDGQECESVRKGTQARLKEPVRDAVLDKTAHSAARTAYLESAGAPNLSPDHDDAVREKTVTGSKGSKSK